MATQTKSNQIPLEITIISADILKTPKFFTRLRTYTTATLIGAGGSISKQRTPIDERGGAKPNWNFPMKFLIDESKIHHNQTMLVIQLRFIRALGNSRDIGLLYLPIKELFDNAGAGARSYHLPLRVSYQVSSPSGKAKGVLYLSYVFGSENGSIGYSDPVSSIYPTPSAPYMAQTFEGGFYEGYIYSNPVPSAPYIGYAS